MNSVSNDMIIDEECDDWRRVSILSPDNSSTKSNSNPNSSENNSDSNSNDAPYEVETAGEIRADNFERMAKAYLPLVPRLEVEAETTYTWNIEGWREMDKKERSPTFMCGGLQWRILFFPFGNNTNFASIYLENGTVDKLPADWYACVQFTLILWNPKDPTIFVDHTANHRFTSDEIDWGFTRFCELRKLFQVPWEGKERPLVENNAAKITAYVRIYKDPTGVLWHNFFNYDSKKMTGMVGLKNQGATCYLNSLLQSLYFTPIFRKAVYDIPTEKEVDHRNNSAYALQRLFYQLQTSNTAVPTLELTAAFGWDSKQSFEQQDVQELSRILMERLEDKMKGTQSENALARMFVGKMKTYISCINVDYESSRIEDFWDIQLNVSGIKNLDASFEDYIQVETMEGENKYFAEGFGLQDARKGVIFESFPRVLHLQLKRFEYDFQRDSLMKINDRYEFPEVWNAEPYLSADADRSRPWIYHLYGILVHSGELNAGHYYAFIRPEKDGPFYKFDDDRVTRATNYEAMEENFGGEMTSYNGGVPPRSPYIRTNTTKRSMNAYMLVYIRECCLDEILLPSTKIEPAKHLEKKIAEELALQEKQIKEREEAHLYMEAQIVTDENFRGYEGYDIMQWMNDTMNIVPPPRSYRILRTMTIKELMQVIAKDLDKPVDMLRPWIMIGRQNGTVRPDELLTAMDLSAEMACTKYASRVSKFLKLWIEEASGRDSVTGKAIWGMPQNGNLSNAGENKPVLLFLKHFDIEKQSLYGVGHFYAQSTDRVMDLTDQILKMMDWPAGTQFTLYEEVKVGSIDAMKPKATLLQSKIQDGDIITVQRRSTDEGFSMMTNREYYTDARDFYDWIVNRITVQFIPKNEPADGETKSFELKLNRKWTYDQWTSVVANKIGADASFIRFFLPGSGTNRTKTPIRHTANPSLGSTLPSTFTGSPNVGGGPKVDTLYYERLEVSLSELENQRLVKVVWLLDGISKEETYEVFVAKTGDVGELLEALTKKLTLTPQQVASIRLFEVISNRITKILTRDHLIAHIDDYSTVYGELVNDEDISVPDRLKVFAVHFDKEPNKLHNVPFVFTMIPGEKFVDTKKRLSARTGIKGKQLEKVKFAVLSSLSPQCKPDYLEDDDVLYSKISAANGTLGLDHVNKPRTNWNRMDSIFIR